MNNTNRFAALIQTPKKQSNTNNNNHNNDFKKSNNKNSIKNDNTFESKKSFESKKLFEPKKSFESKEDSFPKLETNLSNSPNKIFKDNLSTSLNYLNMLQTKQINNKENVDDIVAPGWIKLEKNKITKEVKITYGDSTYIGDEEREITPEEAIDNLVYLHEKRKYDYIKSWGEEDYNKTFRFLNYDYEYFDNLDMKYEIEMDKFIENMAENIDEE